MPYLHTQKKIPQNLDRRVHLSDEDKQIIRTRYKQGEAIRAIARDYEGQASRRLVQFVIFPERLEGARVRFQKWQKEHGNFLQRHGKDKWAETMREHRKYKENIKNELVNKIK